jgi:hypothetical protein
MNVSTTVESNLVHLIQPVSVIFTKVSILESISVVVDVVDVVDVVEVEVVDVVVA